MASKATIKAKATGKAKAAAKWKIILKAKGAAKAQAKDPAKAKAKAKAKVKVKATATATTKDTKKEAAAKAAEKATANDTDKAAAAKAEKEAAAKAAAEEEKKAKTLLWSKFHSSLARACPAIKEKWKELDSVSKWRHGKHAAKNAFLGAWKESKDSNKEWDISFFETVLKTTESQAKEERGIWVSRGRLHEYHHYLQL